jgi:hypothetical protein
MSVKFFNTNTMKAKLILIVVVCAALLTACKDRDAEKKIAALESRLSEMEGKKATTPAAPAEQQPQAEVKPEGPLPVISFDKTDHDFGAIEQGKKVSYTYTFKNTGDAPLIIQSAQPTCGCTVSNYSKDPIPVGGSGFVTAEFDAKAAGIQNKSVTVSANTYPRLTVLKFKALVNEGTPAAK